MLEFKTVILESRDIKSLLSFYSSLLEWPVVFEQKTFVRIQSPINGMGIAFQYDENYTPPVWPDQLGEQQMMIHLDFAVSNKKELLEATQKALQLGAEISENQYGDGEWVTLFDPSGHPFCIVVWD